MARGSPMISRRWLINYVLILLICVFTYVGNRYNVQTGYRDDKHITQLKAQDITNIDIQTTDTSLHLSKIKGHWQIDTPVVWYANNITVERIVDIVNAQTDSRLSISEIDLSTLGLQYPKAILRLNNKQFLFGATNNIGERRYLQIDDTVYLLADRYLPFITQGISGLVDRRLLPKTLPLRSITFNEFRISKNDSGDWISDNAQLSTDQVNKLLSNWQTIEASHIQKYLPDKAPKQRVTARLEHGDAIDFYVLAITPQLVIARPDLGLQYYFNESQYYGLLAAPKNEITTH